MTPPVNLSDDQHQVMDSDAERWNEAEWRNFELWEKIEQRQRRKRRLWITGTVLVFLGLSSIPVFITQWSKWSTLKAAASLAREIGRIKTEAAVEHAAYRIRFKDGGGLSFTVEKRTSCGPQGELLETRQGSIGAKGDALLTTDQGERLGIPGLVTSFCYDALTGSAPAENGDDPVGFGILPVKDLTDGHSDRLSVLLLSGRSANISFE